MARSAQTFEQLIRRIRRDAQRRGSVRAESTAERRVFDVYALGDDLFLLQREGSGASPARERRRSLVLIPRRDLRIGAKGWLCATGTGYFGTILTPLFSGAFGPAFCRVPRARRSETLARRVVLANVSEGVAELFQRETDFGNVERAQRWLLGQGLDLAHVIFGERTPEALAYTERLGQVWRVRPRVYTLREMREAVARAWLRIDTAARYYVSIRGVHWLTVQEFDHLGKLARQAPERFQACLREWAAMAPGESQNALRRAKCGRLHAVEFFGLSRADAEGLFIPAMERLLEGITLGRMDAEDVADTFGGLAILYRRLLTDPAYADLGGAETIRALYACVADDLPGGHDARPDFDARRVALPGASFSPAQENVPIPHVGADRQTLEVIRHLISRLSLNERMEHVNVYELRSSKDLATESAQTREIVAKTNRRPVPVSFIQKRLGSVRAGYADYVLTRANVFCALGADYPAFQLLAASAGAPRPAVPFFLRTRSPGDPLEAIPPALFLSNPGNPGSPELPDVVLALARLYGNAAAQNMAVKKYIAGPPPTSRFGVGKEIFEFVYDPFLHRPMPAHVQVCSIRGTLGWPERAQDETNLEECHRFYLRQYAAVLGDYWMRHKDACTLNECAAAFFDGFEQKIETMHWAYRQNRPYFDAFDPGLRPLYAFRPKLDFALWALERDAHALPSLRERFMDYVRDGFVKA